MINLCLFTIERSALNAIDWINQDRFAWFVVNVFAQINDSISRSIYWYLIVSNALAIYDILLKFKIAKLFE